MSTGGSQDRALAVTLTQATPRDSGSPSRPRGTRPPSWRGPRMPPIVLPSGATWTLARGVGLNAPGLVCRVLLRPLMPMSERGTPVNVGSRGVRSQ